MIAGYKELEADANKFRLLVKYFTEQIDTIEELYEKRKEHFNLERSRAGKDKDQLMMLTEEE